MSSSLEGRPLSPTEQQQLTDLQGMFKPVDALKRVDDFAKWVFTSSAVVGTLGAGFSNAAFQSLSGPGKLVLAVAVLLVGASLFSATLAFEPQWVHANMASRDSMLAAVEANLRKRRKPIQAAAVLFALGLVAAAGAPLASLMSAWGPPQEVVLNYEWKPEGKLWVQLTGVGLNPYAAVEVSVATATTPPVEEARVRRAADANGKAEATLEVLLALPAGTRLHLTGHLAKKSGPDAPLNDMSPLSISVPSAKPVPPAPKKPEINPIIKKQ